MGITAGVLMSSTVGWLAIVVAFVGIAFVVALPIWGIRRMNRMFPKGFDRTGWSPEPGKARRFETMWTYFSGGRGTG
jgi:hypothetical protein